MTNHSLPPAWADRLLGWLCPPQLLEELIGDLHEQFADDVVRVGEQKARQRYVLEVLKFCRPYFLRLRIQSKTRIIRQHHIRHSFYYILICFVII